MIIVSLQGGRVNVFVQKYSFIFGLRNIKKLFRWRASEELNDFRIVLDKIEFENRHVRINERSDENIDIRDIKRYGSLLLRLVLIGDKLYIVNVTTMTFFFACLFFPIGFVQYLAYKIYTKGDGWEKYLLNVLEAYSLISLLLLTIWSFIAGTPEDAHIFYSRVNLSRTELCALISLFSANTGIGFGNVEGVNEYEVLFDTNLRGLEYYSVSENLIFHELRSFGHWNVTTLVLKMKKLQNIFVTCLIWKPTLNEINFC